MRYIAFLLVLAFITGCDNTTADTSVTKTPKALGGYTGQIFTVTHDGHKFVVWDNYRCGGILHHPSCECLTKTNP